MSMNRAQIDRGANNIAAAGPGDSTMSQIQEVTIATVGTGVITAAGMLAGLIRRTGPVAGYADTLDTAQNLMLANPQLSAGDTFEFLFQNTVAFANTVAVAEGAELGTNTAVAASLVRRYLVTILAHKPRQTFVGSITNGVATITGLTQQQCDALMPGMGVSAPAGITAGTTIIGVNSSTGTVTMSANATATNASVVATFFPRYNVRGLYSATA
jgi:hypothetical protein